ncbi:hypothetical protein FE810_00940 [Thalassotalea litorea]|uniref:Uncharacterized protein n=1 Tax=Thalassotalea litorea TaxID=2020715 RepID=A0A5R9IWJ7_9GAMM|nr:hypothetical protein [Thalassotalea litorea]TLU67546.1 hypothetical protein FE810_00940 [Thalassotalea litorea]
MDIQKPLQTLACLARGVDPISKQAFAKDSPYNHPQVIRDLFSCVDYINDRAKRIRMTPEQIKQKNIDKGLPVNCGMPWTPDLKHQLAEQFRQGLSVKDLATKFQRTNASINAELKRQGLITEGAMPEF